MREKFAEVQLKSNFQPIFTKKWPFEKGGNSEGTLHGRVTSIIKITTVYGFSNNFIIPEYGFAWYYIYRSDLIIT